MSRSDTVMMTTTTSTTSDLNRIGTVERDIEQVSLLIHMAVYSSKIQVHVVNIL